MEPEEDLPWKLQFFVLWFGVWRRQWMTTASWSGWLLMIRTSQRSLPEGQVVGRVQSTDRWQSDNLTPAEVCVHGTYKRCLDSIQRRPGSSLQRGQKLGTSLLALVLPIFAASKYLVRRYCIPSGGWVIRSVFSKWVHSFSSSMPHICNSCWDQPAREQFCSWNLLECNWPITSGHTWSLESTKEFKIGQEFGMSNSPSLSMPGTVSLRGVEFLDEITFTSPLTSHAMVEWFLGCVARLLSVSGPAAFWGALPVEQLYNFCESRYRIFAY